jgi:ABC-type sulfate/molybdate transport systems ATPase subunit
MTTIRASCRAASASGGDRARDRHSPLDHPRGRADRKPHSKTGKEILEIFEGLSKKGVTIVLVTHDRSVALHAHRIVHLRDGRIERIEEARAGAPSAASPTSALGSP